MLCPQHVKLLMLMQIVHRLTPVEFVIMVNFMHARFAVDGHLFSAYSPIRSAATAASAEGIIVLFE